MHVNNLALEILEVSSEQRLQILMILAETKYSLSDLAKKLDATISEVHRNLNRLSKAQIISKDIDGKYSLTSYGVMIFSQIPSWRYLIENKKYFEKHEFGNIPTRFIQAIGSLENSQHIKGYVKVQECWKNIYKNSSKYIYNMLHEVSYDTDIITVLSEKIKSGVVLKSIFSDKAIIPNERMRVLEKTNFNDLKKRNNIHRKIGKDLLVFVVLNDKEACVAFPRNDGEKDLSEIFYSDDESFHRWCYDFFHNSWNTSSSFHEDKLEK